MQPPNGDHCPQRGFSPIMCDQAAFSLKPTKKGLAGVVWMLVMAVLTPQIAAAAETRPLEPQSAAAPIRTNFEAVDIHVSSPEDKRKVLQADEAAFHAGRYEIRNATMLDLIKTAYGVE